jgi:hypothetical protein
MSRRSSSFKPLGFELAPGYAAITELSRRRRRRGQPTLLILALPVLAAAGAAVAWLAR